MRKVVLTILGVAVCAVALAGCGQSLAVVSTEAQTNTTLTTLVASSLPQTKTYMDDSNDCVKTAETNRAVVVDVIYNGDFNNSADMKRMADAFVAILGAAEKARALAPPERLIAANESLLDYFGHLESGVVIFTKAYQTGNTKNAAAFWTEWKEADASMEKAVSLVKGATQ